MNHNFKLCKRKLPSPLLLPILTNVSKVTENNKSALNGHQPRFVQNTNVSSAIGPFLFFGGSRDARSRRSAYDDVPAPPTVHSCYDLNIKSTALSHASSQ